MNKNVLLNVVVFYRMDTFLFIDNVSISVALLKRTGVGFLLYSLPGRVRKSVFISL
jgi:hypothetical protein